jgi:hypothetical protein
LGLRQINKVFGVDLGSREEILKEAVIIAKKEVYMEVRQEALDRAEKIAENTINDMRDSHSKHLQEVYE